MSNRRAVALCGILFTTVSLITGCQSNRDEPAPYPQAASRIPFTPQVRQVAIRAGEGTYPNLFTPNSSAIWDPQSAQTMTLDEAPIDTMAGKAPDSAPSDEDTPDPEAMERQMDSDLEPMPPRRPVRRGPLQIDCVFESQFPDRSLAYDAVGLRGLSIHLELPDGQQIVPVQKILDAELGEFPVGALRRYSRKVTLLFPSNNFLVENPAAHPGAPGMRLVVAGLGSTFYFEWHAVPDTLAKTEARADYRVRESVRKGYRATTDRVKRISHTFD